ncbi:MAG: SH3 domain-containing protein [Anaerolineae bacterium]|jgi:N-acetylmuramoyl-L-alanine amidase|nr:SH3 domain-containing protein [Anaerolineae bacterium]
MYRLTFAFLLGWLLLVAQPTPAQTTVFGTVVNADTLNVRTAPTTSAGVIAVIHRGFSYPVIGRTADNGWWLLALSPTNTITGWAFGGYLSVINANAVPVITPPAATPANLSMGTVNTDGLNIRHTPDPYNGVILAVANSGQIYRVIGRNNALPRWWQIQLPDQRVGWVNGRYLAVTNTGLVPVTDQTTPTPIVATGIIVNCSFLNVRTAPNPYVQNVITMVARGQSFRVVGRSWNNWWQVDLGNGILGWVNGRYLQVTNGHQVPYTA